MKIRNKNHWKQWARGLLLVLTFGLVLSLCPQRAAAQTERTVRVGYVNALKYEEGGEGEYKSGAGYEYLQKLSYITGWNYEYVYGSFSECYSWLTEGKIDLFGNVSYTPERAEQVSFSAYPQGKDTYWLYTSKNHPELTEGDLQQLNGCRIGVTGGSYQESLLKQWLESNQIQAKVLECKGYDELMANLNDGTVDAIAAPDLSVGYDCLAIVSIGSSDYYFAVSKSQPSLLSELNMALYEIQSTETDYNTQLFSRYYYQTTSGLAFNKEERQWLQEHDNTIRVGYLEDDLPFSGLEGGKLAGVLGTVLDALEKEYGITTEPISYVGFTQLTQALRDGEIDVAGPVVRDFYLAEQDRFVLTDGMINTTPVVIYKDGDYESSLKVIATANASVYTPGVVSVLFPEAEIRQYDTQDECLKAVSKGEAGCTIIPSSRINILNANPLMSELSFAEISRRQDIGLVATRENRRAATIINKGIEQASDILNGVVLSQHSVAQQGMSLKDFVTTYAWLIIGLAALIIVVLGSLLYGLSVSRKRLVVALREARDANSANTAKTAFLNNMSHDIRTPMNAIIGFTNLAIKQEPESEVEGYLEKIRQSSDYLMSLINDVLDISRIESGKLDYSPVPVDITGITDTVLAVANGFMENRDLDFSVSRQLIQNPYVLADPLRIREVLINIISNAVKFSEDGGRITFTADYHPGKDDRHIVVRYKVSDTGIGMSEEFQERIFDEFTQENAGARTSYKGTGLGMSITKHYVELMGGTISVKSKLGVGSTFTVEIPLELTQPPKSEAAQAAPPKKKDLHGVHALMAEDNDLNAEIATMLLEEQGMVITRAVDGQDAVEKFREAPAGTYAVILMDIMMPRMDGYEATRAIRAMEDRPDGKSIPIIAMTANAFAEDVQKSREAGMNAHLSKPIDVEKMLQTIQEWLWKIE